METLIRHYLPGIDPDKLDLDGLMDRAKEAVWIEDRIVRQNAEAVAAGIEKAFGKEEE